MWTTPRAEPAPVRTRASRREAPRAGVLCRFPGLKLLVPLSRRQLEEITDKSRVLRVLRVCLVLLLMAAAGALGAAAFLLFRRVGGLGLLARRPLPRSRPAARRRAEERVYQLQFQAAADQLAEALRDGLTRKGATASAVAAFLGGTGSRLGTFPNVTWPAFEAFATAQLTLAQSRALSWNPLLQANQLAGWTAYATANIAALGGTPALLATVAATAAATGVYERNAAGVAVRSDPARPFTTPVHQIAPLEGNAAAVFYDLHSQADRRVALDTALATSAPACTAIIQLVQDVRANISRASGIVFAPVQDAAAAPSAPPVGFVSCVFSWDSFLETALPAFITGIDVVLSSPLNGVVFTFHVANGRVATSLPGDVHESGMESRAIRTDLNASALGQYFTLAIYPTAALQSAYLSNNPRDACIGVVCIIAAVAAVFKLYDAAASSYSGQLAAAARAASRIVDGVFPATVRKRLFRLASAPAAPGRQSSLRLSGTSPQQQQRSSLDGGGVAAIRRFMARLGDPRAARDSAASQGSLDGGPGVRPRRASSGMMLAGSAPIADHFDNCTVLFADLAAFTRWSGDATPERVFALLEAVFGEFDAAARSLGVFKGALDASCCACGSFLTCARCATACS